MQKLLLAALPLLASPLLAQGVQEGPEPNESIATATPLALGSQGYGDIAAGDEDWFKITVGVASDLKIWTAPGFAGAIGDTRCRVLLSDGTTEVIDVDDGNTSTHGYYSTFVLGNVAPGDYFVAVRGYGSTTTGSYTLDVVAAAPGTYVAPGSPTLTPVAESAEDNDPRNVGGVATVSAVGTINSGNIHTGGGGASYTDPSADYDFYEVAVASSGTLLMETVTGALSPALGDTVLFLADSGFALLAQDDDSGTGLLSKLSYSVTPGTYYVVVKGWSTGNYDLEIDLTAPLPVGPASLTIQPGGCAGSAGTPALGTRQVGGSGSPRPELPILGSQFFVDGTNMPANAPLMRVIGLDPLPVAYDLGSLGAPGCLIEVDPIDQSFALADGAGVDFWGLSFPANPAFIGLTIEQQLAVLDAAANALGLSVSNRVSSICGITH